MARRIFSVDEILWAFIENTGGARGAVAVSMAGAPLGYVRLQGPGGQHAVIIERYNAALCLTEIHSALPGAETRPTVKITEHPLGHSAGPSMAPFLWGIRPESLIKHYASPADLASAVVDACTQAGSEW